MPICFSKPFPTVEEYSLDGALTFLSFFLQNLLSDIAKKESDLNNVSKNAQLYQQAIKVHILHLWLFSALSRLPLICK